MPAQVTVPTADILNTANATAAAGLRSTGAVNLLNLLPLTPAAQDMFRNRPIDGLLSLAQPVEGFLVDIVARANGISGVYSRRMVNGVDWDMRIDRPGDNIMAPSLRSFMRRLRTVNSYVVLMLLDPGHLSVAAAQVGQARGYQGAQWLGRFIGAVGQANKTGGPPAALAVAGTLAMTLLPGMAGLGAWPAAAVAAVAVPLGTAAISAAGMLTGTVVCALIASNDRQIQARVAAKVAEQQGQGAQGSAGAETGGGGIPGWAIGIGLLIGAKVLLGK
jgi:hypothetical protein